MNQHKLKIQSKPLLASWTISIILMAGFSLGVASHLLPPASLCLPITILVIVGYGTFRKKLPADHE